MYNKFTPPNIHEPCHAQTCLNISVVADYKQLSRDQCSPAKTGKNCHGFCIKYGSWNSMISAHLNRQIFANVGICPYCFLGEEGHIFQTLTPVMPKMRISNGQIPPNTVTPPCRVMGHYLQQTPKPSERTWRPSTLQNKLCKLNPQNPLGPSIMYDNYRVKMIFRHVLECRGSNNTQNNAHHH